MKRPYRLTEWILRFASSQQNVDRVAIWLGGTVSAIAAIFAIVLFAALVFKRLTGHFPP